MHPQLSGLEVKGRHQSRGTSYCGQLQLESSETLGKAGCSTALKNKSSIAQCYPVQTTMLMEKVEFQARVCPLLKTCGQRHSNCRTREGEEPLTVKSRLTPSCLLQLRECVTCLGNTYSHQFPLNIEGKSADCSSLDTHKKAWLCTTELQSGSANAP